MALLGAGAPAPAQEAVGACSYSISTTAAAPRDETFAQLKQLRDCVLESRRSSSERPPASQTFWPRLLDALVILFVAAAVICAFVGKQFGKWWTLAGASAVVVLMGGRLLLDDGLALSAAERRDQRLDAADARWQLEMIRARQTPDADTASGVAIEATRRLIAAAER